MKKGALSLSVEAIIILIIAVTVLGLILSFIYKIWGDVTKKFPSDIPDPTPKADSYNPITLSAETVKTNAKEKQYMKIEVFNPTRFVFHNRTYTMARCTTLKGSSSECTQYGCSAPDTNKFCTGQSVKTLDCTKIFLSTITGTTAAEEKAKYCKTMGCGFKVALPTDAACDVTANFYPLIYCPNLQFEEEGIQINPTTIKQQNSHIFQAILNIPRASPNSYLCQVTIPDFDLSKDFVIEVR